MSLLRMCVAVCIAVYCSVLQCVAVCCSVLQCVAVWFAVCYIMSENATRSSMYLIHTCDTTLHVSGVLYEFMYDI